LSDAIAKKSVDAIKATAEAVEMLTHGVSESAIVQYLTNDHGPDIARQAMVAAGDHFARSAECDRSVVIGWAMEAYREIYRQALTAEDGLSVALKAVKELTTLAMITEGRNVHDKDPEADEE
jgi:hypothetical protein